MTKPLLKIVKNEFKTSRVLPEVKPRELKPPKFEVELIDFHNPNLKWYTSLFRIL